MVESDVKLIPLDPILTWAAELEREYIWDFDWNLPSTEGPYNNKLNLNTIFITFG